MPPALIMALGALYLFSWQVDSLASVELHRLPEQIRREERGT
jgi:hypothetical protein